MLILAGLVTILALTVATAYFVAQEFAYVAVDRSALQASADEGDAGAARALKVTARLSFVLSGAQLGITVTALLAGYVSEPLIGGGLSEILGDAGIPEGISVSVSVLLALLFATVVQMVLGELAAKNYAIARPLSLAKALSRSTLLYLAVAGPIIHVFDTAANKLLRRVGIEPIEELPTGATSEDLSRIIVESESEGLLDADTARLLDNGLDFRKLSVYQVMIPRVDVVMVESSESAAHVVEMLPSGHTRFPVFDEDDSENIIGVVSVSDLLTVLPADRANVTIGSIASEPLTVTDTLSLPRALDAMRKSHRQIACVSDEHGGFAGIITFEDIAEELVGAIHDEDDLPEPTAVDDKNGWWTVPAKWRLDEIADATGLQFPPSNHYETMSGLVMAELGRIPAVGDSMTVELVPEVLHDEIEIKRVFVEVLSTNRYVADMVHLKLLEDESSSTEDES